MPIKPENRKRYPPDWAEIREARRKATGDRCERCGVANHVTGYRDEEGEFHRTGANVIEVWLDSGERFKTIRIVLTLAHLDHQPEHCEPENLQLLCQKCHLDHDRAHHAQSRHDTRRAQRRTMELPF